ncbi:hypothetical protein BC827DRAFT_1228841, partial [Russula dissimulans]
MAMVRTMPHTKDIVCSFWCNTNLNVFVRSFVRCENPNRIFSALILLLPRLELSVHQFLLMHGYYV